MDMIKEVRINVPLIDVLAGMTIYGKILKDLVRNKSKMEKICVAFLNEECFAFVQNKLPSKLGDLGSFLILYTLGNSVTCDTLDDLGASINLMSCSLYSKLFVDTLKPMRMRFEWSELFEQKRSRVGRGVKEKNGVAPSVTVETGNAIKELVSPVVFNETMAKKLNIRTLFTPRGNRIDVVVPSGVYSSYKNTWGKYGLAHSMFKSSIGLFSFKCSSMEGLDAMLENGLWSSYTRVMIELRADVELKDNIVMAMPKITREGHYTCNIHVDGNKKKGVEPTIKVSNSNPFDVLNSVDNYVEFGTNGGTTNLFEDLLTSGQAIFVDKADNPLKKVEFLGEYDSEDEVALGDNDIARSMASERVGFGTQSLLEQWSDSYGNGDYDDDPYDDDMYEGQDHSHELQAICDNLDIRVRENLPDIDNVSSLWTRRWMGVLMLVWEKDSCY
nr:reverse transcriptase domain-containing protein [Tanacetum cinerariifolium]